MNNESASPRGGREFTVEEANELLPALRESLERIREARGIVLAGGEHIKRTSPTDGGGRFGREYLDALDTLRGEVERITEQGIVLRDAETGLLDFPARRDGDEIFLCWRLGEERVAHWHGPDSGFAGRKPL